MKIKASFRSSKVFLMFAVIIFFVSGMTSAHAVSLSIVNPSFEDIGDVILGPGEFTSQGEGLTGWTVEDGVSSVGVFWPAGIYYTEIPDGDYIAYSHDRIISQILVDVLTANTRYTLQVGIGDPNNSGFGGYRIQLRAGGAILAEDSGTVMPTDEFLIATLTFDALAGNPHLGQNIEIVLDSLGLETGFDLVMLDGAEIPIPTALILYVTALACFGRLARQ